MTAERSSIVSTELNSISTDNNRSSLFLDLNMSETELNTSSSSNPTNSHQRHHQSNDGSNQNDLNGSESGLDHITDEELKITLISSVEDKIRNKLDDEVSKTQAELESLHHTNRELLDRQEDICKIEKELDNSLKVITLHNDGLLCCEQDLRKAVSNLTHNIKV